MTVEDALGAVRRMIPRLSECGDTSALSVLADEVERLREKVRLAKGAMEAQDVNHTRQLEELGLSEEFPNLTHLAHDMGEELLAARAEADRLRAWHSAATNWKPGGAWTIGTIGEHRYCVRRTTFGRGYECLAIDGTIGTCIPPEGHPEYDLWAWTSFDAAWKAASGGTPELER